MINDADHDLFFARYTRPASCLIALTVRYLNIPQCFSHHAEFSLVYPVSRPVLVLTDVHAHAHCRLTLYPVVAHAWGLELKDEYAADAACLRILLHSGGSCR